MIIRRNNDIKECINFSKLIRHLTKTTFFILAIFLLNFNGYAYAQISHGLITQWALNEGTGTVSADSSPNNNSLTLVNNPTWVT